MHRKRDYLFPRTKTNREVITRHLLISYENLNLILVEVLINQNMIIDFIVHVQDFPLKLYEYLFFWKTKK